MDFEDIELIYAFDLDEILFVDESEQCREATSEDYIILASIASHLW